LAACKAQAGIFVFYNVTQRGFMFFSLKQGLGRKNRSRQVIGHKHQRAIKSRVHLTLEQLEQRTVPSLFAPAVNYPVGNNPYSVAIGDFNGDGKLDLAVANKNDNNLSILLGNGDGTFQQGGIFPTDSPIFLTAADLNHDGKLDLVTGNNFSNHISVLLGNGDGTFQTAVNYPTNTETVGVAVGDFNKDGIPDLAAASQGAGEVYVLLGNGDGTFQPAVGYACGTFAREVAVGDFNKDGNLDLVVANQGENTVSVLLGSGDGTFQTGVKYATGPDPTSVKVGDFRGNGILDIVTANFNFAGGTGTVSVLLGNGDGTFQAAQSYTTDLHAHSVALADFNNDGRLDIAVANNGSDDVSVLLGNGDGTFQATENFAAGSVPLSVGAGDFNGQGVQSLAVANGASNNVSILINTSGPAAVSLTPNSVAEGSGDFTLTVNGGGFTSTSTVDWDGSPLTTTFVSSSELQADIPAALIADEGIANITVVNPGSTAPLQFSILDNDALSATGYDLSGIEGQQVNGIVATFTDVTYPTNSPDDFTASITWGDSTTSDGTITGQGGLFVVRGSHTYAEEGSYSVKVTINDVGGAATANTSSKATIADAPLSVTATPVNATEGLSFSGQIATFTDGNPNAGLDNFTSIVACPDIIVVGYPPFPCPMGPVSNVTIDWGDGTTPELGNGTISEPGGVGTPFVVNGSHTYADESFYTIKVTITDNGGSKVIGTCTATVADAPLTATGTPVHAAEDVLFSGQVATFTDANPNATLGDYNPLLITGLGDSSSIQINWGDGTTSFAKITRPQGTQIRVSGDHTYAQAGSYTITITINDVGGSSTTTTTTATVIDPTDIVGRDSKTGEWWVGVSNGSGFDNMAFGSWNPKARWADVVTGDFNGDGLRDIAGLDLQTGQWSVSLASASQGGPAPFSEFFSTSMWASWNPKASWADVRVGDFNGDGKADLAAREVDSGQWWVALSNGSSFTTSLWTQWNPNATWVDVQVGDFTGDGKADLAGRVLQTGQWWVAQSTGSSFTNSLWATWNPKVTWVDVQVGDFNGDGKMDLTGRVQENGQWWTALSNGSNFTSNLWATWSNAVTWVDVQVGDFNGDGASDIIGRALETGQWWVGLSSDKAPPSGLPPWSPVPDGSPTFSTTLWSTWSPAVTWVDVQVGDFNGDGKSDITGRAMQTGQWWTGISTGSSLTSSFWGAWSTATTWLDVNSGRFDSTPNPNIV
jgi:hypothetical protein